MFRNKQSQFNSTKSRGFSFLEIMMVVMIIGIMVAIVGPKMFGRSEEARRRATRASMKGVETALGLYEMRVGDFPSTEQGLEALVQRPSDVPEDVWVSSLDEVPRDAWNREFVYRYPGEGGKEYDLVSMGRDGKAGTEDDITNYSKDGSSRR